MDKTIERLLKSPALREYLRVVEDEDLAARATLISAWEAAKIDKAQELESLLKTETNLCEQLTDLCAQLKSVEEKTSDVRGRINAILDRRSRQARRLEQEILAGADICTIEFINWARRAANLAAAATFAPQPNAWSGISASAMDSRTNAVFRSNRHVQALAVAAVDRCEELRRSAVPARELRSELDDLAAQIRSAFAEVAAHAPGQLPKDYASDALGVRLAVS